jgi:hypothetical protein
VGDRAPQGPTIARTDRDEEDAALTRAAAADPDNPIVDERMFARMRPATEVAPEIVRRARSARC